LDSDSITRLTSKEKEIYIPNPINFVTDQLTMLNRLSGVRRGSNPFKGKRIVNRLVITKLADEDGMSSRLVQRTIPERIAENQGAIRTMHL